MIQRLVILLLLLIGIVVAVGGPEHIGPGINRSMAGVRISLPGFQAATANGKTASRAALFNQVLRDDLTFSGAVTIVAAGAQLMAFGSVRDDGSLAVEARLWDLKASVFNREIRGVRIPGDDSDSGARLAAHEFADMIIDAVGGGTRGIAQTKLAYISERAPGVKELYVMDYDGNAPEPVTAFGSIVMTPSWSPDGEKLAFTSYRRNSLDIEVLSRTDHHPYTFERAGGNSFTPAWSPDGSHIAFASSRDGSSPEIYVADGNGRNLHRLTAGSAGNNSPVWNPKTGREIAFISDRTGKPQIYIMDAGGTNVRRLIDEGGGEMDEPAWSPDGARIAFAWHKRKTPGFDIYIHELATGETTQLTKDAGNNERPTWAPDGRHLAFESSRNGGRQIFAVTLDGMQIRQLTKAGRNTAPAWSGYLK